MKHIMTTALFLMMGMFLCVNDRTCIPCMCSILHNIFLPCDLHHHHCDDHGYHQDHDDHQGCCQHIVCPDPSAHQRFFPIQDTGSTRIDGKNVERLIAVPSRTFNDLGKDNLFLSFSDTDRFIYCLTFPDRPLFILHEQFLI